jgi:hypothetical protein
MNMTERSVDTQADLRARYLWKVKKSARVATATLTAVVASRNAPNQRSSHAAARFSKNAPMPSAASRRSIFSTITCVAKR